MHKKIESAPTAPRHSRAPATNSQRAGHRAPVTGGQRTSQSQESFDTHEKALLRELCNVSLVFDTFDIDDGHLFFSLHKSGLAFGLN